MIEIEAQVVGVESVSAKLSTLAAVAQKRIKMAVQGLGTELQGAVKQSWLSGGALNVQSGRLRRSITEKTTETGNDVRSRTGTNVEYGRFWELGFHDVENVKAHVRKIASRSLRETKKHGKAQGIAFVKAFSRRVDQNARPFLKPALASMRAQVHDRLTKAVEGLGDGR